MVYGALYKGAVHWVITRIQLCPQHVYNMGVCSLKAMYRTNSFICVYIYEKYVHIWIYIHTYIHMWTMNIAFLH